ncbi:MAG: hypothetical protein E7588_10255 [Ruminococcaceae bacterium]|nr:hypothetical protein [Oscillospiraceae bacterium]
MKAKKLLSILLFSLLACVMLAVYASAEVDTYYFAGDYLYYNRYSAIENTKNPVSTVAGALHIDPYTTAPASGTARFRFFPNGDTTTLARADYPYMTINFINTHPYDLQFWPFTQKNSGVNTAYGTKLHSRDTKWGNCDQTSNGVWRTAKISFNIAEAVVGGADTVGAYITKTPDSIVGTSERDWLVKLNDLTPPAYYQDLAIQMREGTPKDTHYSEYKYVAIHSKKADMYGSDGMDAMLDVVAFGDEVITYYIAPTATENDFKAYIKSAIETKFDGAVVTVGNQLSDKTFVTNAAKEYTYLVTVEYEGVKAYDGFNIKVVPMPTFDALDTLGAQIRTSADSFDLRFGFTIDTAAIPAVCTLVEYGAVIGKEGSTPVLGNENEYAVVRSTKEGFKVKETVGTVNTYTAVVDNIPDGTGEVVNQRGTALVARPYLTYKVNGENYTVYGDSVTRSYNDVLSLANGEWSNN